MSRGAGKPEVKDRVQHRMVPEAKVKHDGDPDNKQSKVSKQNTMAVPLFKQGKKGA